MKSEQSNGKFSAIGCSNITAAVGPVGPTSPSAPIGPVAPVGPVGPVAPLFYAQLLIPLYTMNMDS